MKKEAQSPKANSDLRQPQTIRSKILRHQNANGESQILEDTVVVESPLEISVQYPSKDEHTVTKSISMTMRTPGADSELALGYLVNEGIVKSESDLSGPVELKNPNQVTIPFRSAPDIPESRNLTTASCGICSSTSIQTFLNHKITPLSFSSSSKFSADFLYSLPKKLLEDQAAFSKTGGLHAAAVYDSSGNLITLQEDIGRHNAVDKVAGFLFRNQLLHCQDDQLLLVSSRISYEIVQKALKIQIPILVGLGPASSLAIDYATQAKLTLVGFLSEKKFNIYSCPQRILSQ